MKYLPLLFILITGCATSSIFRTDSAVLVNESSGFKIDRFIATANHVAEADTVIITDYWGRKYTGTIVARDTTNDIALITYPRAIYVDYSTATIRTREKVYSVGSPFMLTFTESEGMVQNIERTDDIVTYIQIGIDVGWGSSGSPVFNGKRRLVGMIVRAMPGTRFTFITDIQNVILLIQKQKR